MSSQSVGANCEKDNCKNLSNFKQLLCTTSTISPPKLLSIPLNLNIPVKSYINKNNSKLALACQSYVAGAIIQKIKKITNNCKLCFEILSSENSKYNYIINTRQYDNCNLQTPSVSSTNVYNILLNEFNSNIDAFFIKPNIKQNFLNYLQTKIKLPSLCTSHDTKRLFLNYAFKILIFAYIKNINRVLKGEKVQSLCSEPGKIINLAANYYEHFKLKKHKILKNCNMK